MAVPVTHRYRVTVRWTGNRGSGTSDYRAYARDHDIEGPGRAAIPGSSDPAYRGDPARWNPEELLVAALSQCHMLWYLHLAAEAGVVVTDYVDTPVGTLEGASDGVGQFAEVVLHPVVTVAQPAMGEAALALHADVGAKCAIARSVAFPVRHRPAVVVAEPR
jgi:organic hydroperoxide reductase OsmC/OhrA